MTTRKLNGETVRIIRERTGIRSGAFARRIDLDPGYFSKIEHGKRQPSPLIVRRIAHGLGVSVEAITYPDFNGKPVIGRIRD